MASVSTTATVSATTTKPNRGPRWANRLAIAAMLLLVLGPLLADATRREIAAWHGARGVNAVWERNFSEAIAHYDNAIAWDPYSPRYFTLRAKANLELDQPAKAITDAEHALELASERAEVEHVYTSALLRAGRGKEAADYYEKQLPYLGVYDGRERAGLQNNIAAILATAKIDLDRALKHVEEALEYDPDQPSVIDTRAMVLYSQGKYAKALEDSEKAIRNPGQLTFQIEHTAKEMSADDRHRAYQVRDGKHLVAQLLYHRALIHEGLAKEAKDPGQRITHQIRAVQDRQTIRDLGFTPDEKLF